MSATAATRDLDELTAVVHGELERWSVPGMAIGVLRNGAVETLACGVASLETGFPVLPDTLFQAGSISKIVTTTLIMQLVDEGRLALDAPVVSYLPSLRLGDPEATRTLTPRHLLTHMGGFFGDRFDDYGPDDGALARAVDDFITLRQYTPPGAFWAYNNLGFQLAGRVAESILGVPFETAVRERIFGPLGMHRTTYFAQEAITYPVATGHNLLPGQANAATHVWARARCRNSQGGLTSTVADLLRFAGAHVDAGSPPIISPAGVAEMRTPQVAAIQAPHWGLGWWIDPIGEEPVIGHGGVTNGFQAQLTLAPQCGVAFAFLSNGNQGGAAIRAIEAWLCARYLHLQRVEPAAVPLPEASLARLAGRYERVRGRFTVTADGTGLRVVSETVNPFTRTDWPPVAAHAEPIGDDRFRFTDGVDRGRLFDFVEEGRDGAAHPRYLRIDNRLADRVA